MANLNTYLTDLSYNYFISYGTDERESIKTSIETLEKRLKSDFGDLILDVQIFGSWKRDTTLPRKYDVNSDIDFLIIFDHNQQNRTPETYRNWINDFAQDKYASSISKKNFPTIRLDMQHITFDLVPSIIEKHSVFNFYYIPNSGNNWMQTNPFEFNQEVINANKYNQSMVKPVLRLMKAWNSNNGYPFESYDLETRIMKCVNFGYGNIESCFFEAVNCLPYWNGPESRNNKVLAFRKSLKLVQQALLQDNRAEAINYLHKSLPSHIK